jgi:hypothetical protein
MTENELLQELIEAAQAGSVPDFDPSRQVSADTLAAELGWRRNRVERFLKAQVEAGKLRAVPVILPTRRRGTAYERV